MNDKTKRIAHYASLFMFITVWIWLMNAGAFKEVNFWFDAGFFIMGTSFAVGLLTKQTNGSRHLNDQTQAVNKGSANVR